MRNLDDYFLRSRAVLTAAYTGVPSLYPLASLVIVQLEGALAELQAFVALCASLFGRSFTTGSNPFLKS